jgi:Protein of unknown function (DUF3305)
MEKSESLPLGVVIERRKVDHPWKDHDWRPVGVIPGAPDLDPSGEWTVLREGEGWVRYHAGTLALQLFRAETESYRINLSQEPPRIFVVLRSNSDADIAHDLLPFLVTASPFEAQHYLDSGEEIVEVVTMPPEVLALVSDFVETHHVEEAFIKRKRKGVKGKDEPFSRPPPSTRPGVKRSGLGNGEN